MAGDVVRERRAPPAFVAATVLERRWLSARLARLILGGDDLEGMRVEEPAASIRLLVPPAHGSELELPRWAGNEFLYADGSRPSIRSLTPGPLQAEIPPLHVDIVTHGGGRLGTWAETCALGAATAVSGPGPGYVPEPGAQAFHIGGDETALAAIAQLLSTIDGDTAVSVDIEVATDDVRLDLPVHPRAQVRWHLAAPGERPGTALVAAVSQMEIVAGSRVWMAGEAASMQRIRRHLFEDKGVDRSTTCIRGYWKYGRSSP